MILVNSCRRGVLVLAVVSASLGSCIGSRDESQAIWSHPEWRTRLNLSRIHTIENFGGTELWRQGSMRLIARNADAVAELSKIPGKMVMVTLRAGTRLAHELARDPLTLGILAPTETRAGAALVVVPNATLHAALADAAHRDARGACGAIEVLDLLATQAAATVTPSVFAEPTKLPEVAALLEETNSSHIDTTIRSLEAMGSRRQYTSTGLNAPSQVKALFETAAGSQIPGMTVELHTHQATEQKSVIVTIPGQKDDTITVILGAHLDSINRNGSTLPAPGADDDGSGIATLVEIVRVLALSQATFERRVELHAYAAEEDGLVGSKDLARTYATQGRKVAAMMQFDMNSWASQAGNDTVYLIKTDTISLLLRAAKDLMHAYIDGGFKEEVLEHGTSDHKAWSLVGYPTVFPFENPTNYNEALHTLNDTSTTINALPLAERMARLGLIFIAHEAGLSAARDGYATAYASVRASVTNDLRLAIRPSPQVEGTFVVNVATPTTAKTVDLCTISEAGSMACTEDRLPSGFDHESDDRRFFGVTATVVLEDGARLAVFAYDESDKLIGHRSVRLVKK